MGITHQILINKHLNAGEASSTVLWTVAHCKGGAVIFLEYPAWRFTDLPPD
jgi:hypothetical protein